MDCTIAYKEENDRQKMIDRTTQNMIMVVIGCNQNAERSGFRPEPDNSEKHKGFHAGPGGVVPP
jgi:hypothetical protein